MSRHDWCNGGCEVCDEKPELFDRKTVGWYSCPRCGMMVLAGMTHPTCAELDSQILNAEGPMIEEWLDATED